MAEEKKDDDHITPDDIEVCSLNLSNVRALQTDFRMCFLALSFKKVVFIYPNKTKPVKNKSFKSFL